MISHMGPTWLQMIWICPMLCFSSCATAYVSLFELLKVTLMFHQIAFPFPFFTYLIIILFPCLLVYIYIYMGVLWGKRWCFRFLFNFLLQIWLNLKWHGKILIEIMSSFCWRLVNNDKKKHQWSVELALQWCLSFQFRLLHSLFSFYFKFWKSFFLSCPPLILQW